MKTLLLCLIVILPASAATFNYSGLFTEQTKTFIFGYEDQATCEEDQGSWDAENLLCLFDVENSVSVTPKEDKYFIQVSTVGANAHMCDYEGNATLISDRELLSTEATTRLERGANGEWVEVPALCEVKVIYEDENTVQVISRGECFEFCGMRARLDIERAVRK